MAGPRILVFGRTGQLAQSLAAAPWPAAATVTALGREQADLAQPASLGAVVAAHAPDLVVIAAAHTAVDKAETEEALATLINGEAPGVIADAAARRGAPVIHVSTDYVFDGSKTGWYEETDPVAPLGAYGRSKEFGERQVRSANPRHVILRTAWVYSPFGNNFLRTMLRLAEARDRVTIVADQQGCPTTAGEIARAIAALTPMALAGDAAFGTYHASGATDTTWHGFAEAIFAELAKRGRKRPENAAIPTSAYPTPAARPANSRLSCRRLHDSFGLRLAGFEQEIPKVLDALL